MITFFFKYIFTGNKIYIIKINNTCIIKIIFKKKNMPGIFEKCKYFKFKIY